MTPAAKKFDESCCSWGRRPRRNSRRGQRPRLQRIWQRSSESFVAYSRNFSSSAATLSEFPGVNAKERGFERLMPGQRIEQRQEIRFVREGEKTDQALGLIVKCLDADRKAAASSRPARRAESTRRSRSPASAAWPGSRAHADNWRARLWKRTAQILHPTSSGIPSGVKSMKHQMGNFVPQKIAAKFVGRIAQDEEAPLRMNPARPLLQTAGRSEIAANRPGARKYRYGISYRPPAARAAAPSPPRGSETPLPPRSA